MRNSENHHDRNEESQKIRAVLRVTPDVRAERVEALKKAIASGQYVVKSDLLADKIIKESLWELKR